MDYAKGKPRDSSLDCNYVVYKQEHYKLIIINNYHYEIALEYLYVLKFKIFILFVNNNKIYRLKLL